MLRDHAARASAPTRTDPAVAAVIGRLTTEFLEQAGPLTVVRVIAQARHDRDELHPRRYPSCWNASPGNACSRRPADEPQRLHGGVLPHRRRGIR